MSPRLQFPGEWASLSSVPALSRYRLPLSRPRPVDQLPTARTTDTQPEMVHIFDQSTARQERVGGSRSEQAAAQPRVQHTHKKSTPQ